jgi:hypothetical protein
MGRAILDPKLIDKLTSHRNKSEKYIRESVSKLANRLGVPSEVALIVMAKREGIGTALFQRTLDPAKQAQVRDALQNVLAPPRAAERRAAKAVRAMRGSTGKRTSVKPIIEYVLQDATLRDRCQDLLMARSNFDRAINIATVILEDRIRKKAKPPTKMVGEPLVNFAFKDDSSKTVLRVASKEPDDQRGFTHIMRGMVAAFRNSTHHHIIDSFTREEALRIVGFVDVLLGVVENSVKVRETPG